MEYTENYQLPQWVETDRIMMEDFNDMTNKIDAALAECNCRVYYMNYTGSGEHTKVHIFETQPLLVITVGPYDWAIGIYNASCGLAINVPNGVIRELDMKWTENSVVVSGTADAQYICNTRNNQYFLVALLAST